MPRPILNHFGPTPGQLMGLLFDSDRRRIQEAKAESRARAQARLAQIAQDARVAKDIGPVASGVHVAVRNGPRATGIAEGPTSRKEPR